MPWALYVSMAAALAVAPMAGYLGLLALLARTPRRRTHAEPPLTRFAVVIPAHDEEQQIAATVKSVLRADYPAKRRRVIVVADNCTDRTAERASDAGALVWERIDRERRGKGYALEYAFERLVREGEVDAFVVVDADTVVSSNLLRAFDTRLQAGAMAVQAEYGVRNVEASWRTRLMTVALAMFHRTRSLARERLGLSVGLRGNGMCFSRALLEAHPHRAYGLVEDVEYGVSIGLAGHRVWFAEEARVLGEMVSTGAAARTQRQRWEGGRLQLARTHLPRLVRAGLARRSAMLLDLAMDIVVPPLSYVGLAIGAGLVAEGALGLYFAGSMPSAWLWLAEAAALLLYVGRGVQHSGLGMRGVAALAYAPAYVLWKLVIARPFKRDDAWIRTRREAQGRDETN